MKKSILFFAIMIITVIFILGCASCLLKQDPPPPGYDGPIVSMAGQMTVRELRDMQFVDHDAVYGRGKWVVKGFAVIPNPVTGKGPVAILEREPLDQQSDRAVAKETVYLPMEIDGDAADLYRRVTGKEHKTLSKEMSSTYQKVLKK